MRAPSKRGPVEHRGRALGRPGRRARVARDERRTDERDEHDARGDLVRPRRDPLAELASARRTEQEVEAGTDGRDDEDREPRAAQRVDDEGARDGADRLLRAAEEAQVVLEVLGQALERVRLPHGREVGGDLLDRDVGAQAERQRRVDLDGPERAEVDGDEAVRRDLVQGLVRAEAALGRRRRDPTRRTARGRAGCRGSSGPSGAGCGADGSSPHSLADPALHRQPRAPCAPPVGTGGAHGAGRRQDLAPRSVTSATPAATSMSTTPMNDVVRRRCRTRRARSRAAPAPARQAGSRRPGSRRPASRPRRRRRPRGRPPGPRRSRGTTP